MTEEYFFQSNSFKTKLRIVTELSWRQLQQGCHKDEGVMTPAAGLETIDLVTTAMQNYDTMAIEYAPSEYCSTAYVSMFWRVATQAMENSNLYHVGLLGWIPKTTAESLYDYR